MGKPGQIDQDPGSCLLAERFAGRRPLPDPQPTGFDKPGLAGSGKCVLKGVGGGEEYRAVAVAIAVAGIRELTEAWCLSDRMWTT